MIFRSFLFLGLLGLLALPVWAAHAEETESAIVSETLAPPEEETAQEPAKEDIKEDSKEEERPAIRPTHILPSKIKPVQAEGPDDDALSQAVPDTHHGTSETDDAPDPLVLSDVQKDFISLSLWSDLSESAVKDVLSNLPSKGQSPTLQHMEVALIEGLTPEDATQDSKDLYALRLSKLMEFGEFSKALAVYKNNGTQAPSSLAAKAGIVSMLVGDETALGCLEEKALSEDITQEDKPFWSKVDLFCTSLLSPAAGDDDSLRFTNAARIFVTAQSLEKPDTIEALNGMDPVSVMVLGTSGLLNDLLTSPEALPDLDNLPLAVLLRKGPKSPEIYLNLLSEATRRGIESLDTHAPDFAAYLERQENPNQISDPKLSGYTNFLKQYINTATIPTAEFFHQTVNLFGHSDLLLPLFFNTESLSEFNWKILPAPDRKEFLRILILTNREIPPALVSAVFSEEDSPEQAENKKESTGEKILFRYFSKEENGESLQTPPEILAIQPFLLSGEEEENFKTSVYDNIFNLTESDNYVMPTDDILSDLKKAANKKPSVQVVIKSLNTLAAQPLEKFHPAALYRILGIFNSAGLSVQTKALGHEVLGHILEN